MGKIAVSLILACLLNLIGCAPPPPSAPIKVYLTPVAHHYLHMDPAFSAEEQKVIVAGIDEWQWRTHGYIQWTWLPYPRYNPVNPEMEYKAFDETEEHCSKHILLMKMYKDDRVITAIEKAVGYRISGYANRTSDRCGLASVYIVSERVEYMSWLRIVAIHELGHQLGLNHEHKELSIMNKQPTYKALCLTRHDFENFCALWGCQPEEFDISCGNF